MNRLGGSGGGGGEGDGDDPMQPQDPEGVMVRSLCVTLFSLTVRYDWTGFRLPILTIYRLHNTMTKHDVAAQDDS
jgi:hypothetical protein